MAKKQPEITLETELLSRLNSLKSKIKTKEEKLRGSPVANELFWYEPPVSPKEFIESDRFLGNKARGGYIRPWVIETMEEIFSYGPYYLPKYQTAAIICGKGSGKSYLTALMNCYMTYQILSFKSFTTFLHTDGATTKLDPTTTLMLIGMAKSTKQAKEIVFDTTKKFIHQVAAFRERGWLPNPDVTTELQYSTKNEFGEDFKKLLIVPGNSSETFAVGFALYGGVIDEAGLFREKRKDPVETIYNELNFRRHSRFGANGIITLISSATTEDVFIEKLYAQASKDNSIFALRKSTYDCDPKYFLSERFSLTASYETGDGQIKKTELNPPKELKMMYEFNLHQALRDINGIPSLVGAPFYPDFVLLTSKINKDRIDPCPDAGKDKSETPNDVMQKLPEWFRGIPGCKYRIHGDLAKGAIVDNQCGLGLAMVHKIADPHLGYKVKLDLAVRFKAPTGHEIQIDSVLALIKWLKEARGFDIDYVTFDQWNSLMPIQTIESWHNGMHAGELKVGYKEHTFLKTLALTGQFDWYEDTNLLFELKRLEDFGDSVDHSPTSFKDEADAVAGAVYSVAALEPDVEIIKPRATMPVLMPRITGSSRPGLPPGLYRGGINPRQRFGPTFG